MYPLKMIFHSYVKLPEGTHCVEKNPIRLSFGWTNGFLEWMLLKVHLMDFHAHLLELIENNQWSEDSRTLTCGRSCKLSVAGLVKMCVPFSQTYLIYIYIYTYI